MAGMVSHAVAGVSGRDGIVAKGFEAPHPGHRQVRRPRKFEWTSPRALKEPAGCAPPHRIQTFAHVAVSTGWSILQNKTPTRTCRSECSSTDPGAGRARHIEIATIHNLRREAAGGAESGPGS